jgi:uncharacterized membrane protein YqhA
LQAGLFSASLTAFLIESYKMLNPDSGDTTVRLLAQISQQLPASANGSAFSIPPPLKSTPSAAALVCNALWFISLGLSLSCALIATLLEQWARDFIHRSEIRSAPLIRARIFAFLYYGLKRFNMHTVVEIIPLLLHMSLLFFFSGLVAFLFPVNLLMAAIAATILIIVTGVYSVFTILPLRYLDSPYRTPLSGTFWRVFQSLKIKWLRRDALESTVPYETIIGAICRVAVEVSEDRTARDEKALIWTVRSLSDEVELEPFVEAIPDILWGPNGRRTTYSDIFRNLVNNPDIALGARIHTLYNSCETGLLSLDGQKRRKIICYRAVWAITTLLDSLDSAKIFLRSIGSWASSPHGERDQDILHFARSVQTLIQWRTFQNDKLILQQKLQYLSDCEVAAGGVGEADLTPVLHFLDDLAHHRDYFVDIKGRSFKSDAHVEKSSVLLIPALIDDIDHILETTPYLILFPYLRQVSELDALPYFFRRTVDIIRPPPTTPAAVRYDLDATLGLIVPVQLAKFNGRGPEWMDSVMNELMPYWPQQDTPSFIFHPAFIQYLNGRLWDKAVWTSVSRIWFNDQLWDAFALSIANDPPPLSDAAQPPKEEILTALWRLISLGFSPNTSILHRILEAVVRLKASSARPSAVALLKSKYLRRSRDAIAASQLPEGFTNLIFPTLTAVAIPTESGGLAGDDDSGADILPFRQRRLRVAEATVVLFAEFLEYCAGPEPFPHQAIVTLQSIDTSKELSAIHDTHQIRFANAIWDVFGSPRCVELRAAVMNCRLFDVFADPSREETTFWLDNRIARETIVATLTRYADECASADSANRDIVRLRAIIDGINLLPQTRSYPAGTLSFS